MGGLSPAQREIAAQIIEKRGFSLTKDSTPDEREAAGFVFDHGLLMKPAMFDEFIKMFREPTAERSSSQSSEKET